MLLRTAEVAAQVRKWYENFEFHRIYQQLNEFCTVDLSNVYFDVLKDRLYTSAPESRARRSGQTAVWRIGEALVRLVAPLMSFTAEEIWSFLPKVAGRPESVHVAYFPEKEDITGQRVDDAQAEALLHDFNLLMSVRDTALKLLEVARQEKLIGSALEAVVTIQAPTDLAPVVERYSNDLRFLLIVSGIVVKPSPAGNGSAPLHVVVDKAPGAKCERCWNYSVHVGGSARYPTVCERCLQALEEIERALPA
jgi:isoleucyl-tRNA synthetase